jgi:hypothetical protein
MEILTTPRRRKTKRKGTIYVLPYKQATPTGFATQADNREHFIRPKRMWVRKKVGNLRYLVWGFAGFRPSRHNAEWVRMSFDSMHPDIDGGFSLEVGCWRLGLEHRRSG